MTAGGPLEAIASCNLEAPEIAKRLAAESGAVISRTALRVRNRSNLASPGQIVVLKQFQHSLVTGNGPLEQFDLSADGSARYMKAIPMQAMCLNCHGTNLVSEVQETINQLYPQDQATGFAADELRGAFLIQWPPTNRQQQ